MALYSIHEDTQCRIQLGASGTRICPCNPIDLGVFPPAQGEGAGDESCRVVVGLDRPGHDDLPGTHHGLTQGQPRLRWRIPAGLLDEFACSSLLLVLAIFDEALEESPSPGVTSSEERPAGMGDQDLQTTVEAIGEKTRRSHKARHYAGWVTALATYPTPQGRLAQFDSRLQLGRTETLGAGIKRVTMEQLEVAAAGYFEGEAEFGRAIHESRKAIKRVRSLLRLVQGEIPKRILKYEDKTLRDTSRTISEIRSAAAIVGAATVVTDLYGDLLAEGTFQEMLERLGQRRDRVELRALEDPRLVGRIVRNLERAYHRYAGWPTDADAREIYGMGIRDDFAAIRPGLHETYGRGRTEMVAAYQTGSSHDFHAWRKRAKYLRHQMEFLAPLWPETVIGMAVTLDLLGEVLGEDHDLAEVVDLIHDRPELCPNPRERSLFTALASQRRAELELAAEVLGRRIYAEKPDSLQSRFSEYWDSRQLAIGRPLDTLTIY